MKYTHKYYYNQGDTDLLNTSKSFLGYSILCQVVKKRAISIIYIFGFYKA